MIKATWMSNNILTIESLLADSVPTSNYEWADEFPNLYPTLNTFKRG